MPSNLPESLETTEFRSAWSDFQEHRRQVGHKLTPLATKRLLAKLERAGPDAALAALELSIENGWTGVFPSSEGQPSSVGGRGDNGSRTAELSPLDSRVARLKGIAVGRYYSLGIKPPEMDGMSVETIFSEFKRLTGEALLY